MTSVDFLIYCVGVGVLLLSGAGAFHIAGRNRMDAAVPPPPEATADLAGRLQKLQEQRFATIMPRQPRDYVPTPGEPGTGRMVPIRRRPFSPPRQAPPPLKPKQEPTKKD